MTLDKQKARELIAQHGRGNPIVRANFSRYTKRGQPYTQLTEHQHKHIPVYPREDWGCCDESDEFKASGLTWYEFCVERKLAWFTRWNHPIKQARLWGMPPLYRWQKEVMAEIALPRSRSVVSTNNESGKTNVILPLFGLSIMTAFAGATVFSTAGAEAQIEGQLFKYLADKLKPYEKFGWKVNTNELKVEGPVVNGLQSVWEARVPRDILTMEGYHRSMTPDSQGVMRIQPVAVLIDEAKSVRDKIFEQGFRINPDWMLAISTPNKDSGAFYKAMDPDTLGEDRQYGAKVTNTGF